MAYKLIQIENGVILTGDALKAMLNGFTIPVLPALLPYPVKPNIADYQPNIPENQARYYADWNAWRNGTYMTYYARVQEREIICKDFALTLRGAFSIGLVRRSGITISTADRYLQFAMILTELHKPFTGDKIDWICNNQIN
jgi:hypothetical protein